MLEWNEQFETGHVQIDDQHRTLISYMNRLGAMPLTTNPSREELEFVLGLVDFIQSYTEHHFQHEEHCMHRHQCPAYQKNKDEHGTFLEFFHKFKRRFQNEGYHPGLAKELYETCSSWITSHILRVDLRLKEYKDDNGSGI